MATAKKNSLKRFFLSLSLAILVTILIRSLFFEPFHIPSGSMKSTLMPGDYIFVSKYYYGYSKFSFPFAPPIFKDRIFYYNKLKSGDVVVFRPPKKSNINYIKRIIGLPGDKIQIKNGRLYINGLQMHYKKTADFVDTDNYGNKVYMSSFIETLYNHSSHRILEEIPNNYSLGNTPVYTVPVGHVFVLGDNRNNSQDSRFITEIGYIPIENIVGKAYVVALSFKKNSGNKWLPFSIRSDRIWSFIY